MGVIAHEFAEFCLAHASGGCQRSRVREILWILAHARHQPFEQRQVRVLAAVVKIGTAAFAGSQARFLGVVFGLEKTHILGLRRPRATRWQAVNPRRQHAYDEFAVIAPAMRELTVEWVFQIFAHGTTLTRFTFVRLPFPPFDIGTACRTGLRQCWPASRRNEGTRLTVFMVRGRSQGGIP